ncbi:hypothetical protein CNBG_0932 [Cryptococcus deuterogattii R265]|uniref:uncharacterized protein n=1 Tax=Cryptococcus deuterogattii (strain R265) TaxID=294750 RepID=UPI0019363AB2|nr:hypothetical protein CNBG_0932 [Cryptococcus deuterogattii R265]
MAAPPPEVYLADGFDPSTLRNLRSAAANVQPSNEGIISVSDNGDETPAIPVKRPRKSRRAAAEPELTSANEAEPEMVIEVEPDHLEPPIKKLRPKSKSVVVEIEQSPAKRSRVGKQPTIQVEDVDRGAEARLKVEPAVELPTPSRRTTRGRASVTPGPSAFATDAQSSSLGTEELRTPIAARTVSQPHSTRRRESKTKIMDHVQKENKKEDEMPEQMSKARASRRSEGEQSSFSDFNPFQSGSEDAAERERRRRKSSIGFGSSNKFKVAKPRSSEPAPAHVTTPPGILRRVGPSRDNIRTPLSDGKRATQSGSDLDAAVAYNQEVQEKLNQISAIRPHDERDETKITIHSSISSFHPPKSLVKRVNDQINQSVPAPQATLPLSILFLLLLTFISNFQNQSSSIGFCDTGSNTNEITLHRQASRSEAEMCLLDKAKLDMVDKDAATKVICDTTNLPLIPFLPVPASCTACPPHAQCLHGEIVSCAPEYKLVAHPLSFLAPLANGFPGIGPRPFPPACKPDTAKRRMIGTLAKAVEKSLAQHRGDIVCQTLSLDQGEVERYGVDEEALRERFSGQKNSKLGREAFDELFSAAIKDLVEHEDLVVFIDVENDKTSYAATRTELTLACRAKLEVTDLLHRWKSQLGSTAAVLLAIAYIRSEVNRRKQEKYRAEELVQVALKRLQDQEQLHYTDPVTNPQPFIPRDQLRDLVMPHTGSAASRLRLWTRVLDMVEHNANVAVRDQELKGEIWKTWEWAGIGERHVTWEQ